MEFQFEPIGQKHLQHLEKLRSTGRPFGSCLDVVTIFIEPLWTAFDLLVGDAICDVNETFESSASPEVTQTTVAVRAFCRLLSLMDAVSNAGLFAACWARQVIA